MPDATSVPVIVPPTWTEPEPTAVTVMTLSAIEPVTDPAPAAIEPVTDAPDGGVPVAANVTRPVPYWA